MKAVRIVSIAFFAALALFAALCCFGLLEGV